MAVEPIIVTATEGKPLSILNLNVTCPTVSVTAPIVTNHSCTDGVCQPDANGIYPTLADCIASGCAAPPPSEGGGGAIMLVGLALLGLMMTSKKK